MSSAVEGLNFWQSYRSQQAADRLTGESLPADKIASAADHADAIGPDAPNLLFLGTSVVSGTGTALALATGPKTMFGDIAVRLRSRAPETEFEHGRQLARRLGPGVITRAQR
jgi:Mg2+-importing ATPase